MKLDKVTVGFIGGGNMAKAIGFGLLKRGVLSASRMWVSALSNSTLESWKSSGVNTTVHNGEVVENCDIIILACKPYQISNALNIGQTITVSKLYVSILVGVSCDSIFSLLNNGYFFKPRIIRAMPNIAVDVGEGCTVLSHHNSVCEEDVEMVKELFSALGKCEIIEEKLMASVAALSGSGPAYIFMVIEAMADGAVKQGVSRELAYTLAAQTVAGASKLVLETKKHPGQLKDEVCSPGGTTICAVHELEKGNLRGIFMSAIEKAVIKAKLIGSSSLE